MEKQIMTKEYAREILILLREVIPLSIDDVENSLSVWDEKGYIKQNDDVVIEAIEVICRPMEGKLEILKKHEKIIFNFCSRCKIKIQEVDV